MKLLRCISTIHVPPSFGATLVRIERATAPSRSSATPASRTRVSTDPFSLHFLRHQSAPAASALPKRSCSRLSTRTQLHSGGSAREPVSRLGSEFIPRLNEGLSDGFNGSSPLLVQISRRAQTTRCTSDSSSGGASAASSGGGDVEALSSGQDAAGAWTSKAEGEPSVVPDLLDYLNVSWTPFHATAEAKARLLAAGFTQLSERDEWELRPGGRYFFTRNMSSIFAFAVGGKYEAGKGGFNVIAAHTDSPCPKLKPVSSAVKSGFLVVGVQPYGGGLWHTWFDRDLSVAGRVLLRTAAPPGGGTGGGGGVTQRLVKVARPILRIPTLAIHLDRTIDTDGFKPNLESHLAPILATQLKAELNSKGGSSDGSSPPPPPPPAAGAGAAAPAAVETDPSGAAAESLGSSSPHHPLLIQVLANELACDPSDIIDFELNVCDTHASCLGGARDEFVLSGRLDNLASCFCALRALADTCADEADLSEETGVRMIALFDDEEVGSRSAQGAGSPALFETMKRIVRLLSGGSFQEGLVGRSIRRSFVVSADMAHALHPNYAERHEERHQPRLHRGLVVKFNANQRYATNMVSSYLFREIAKRNGIPTQSFVVRNDMGCGSTIGPILASGVGIRTVDVGMPQLSMHSVREMCGTKDIDIAYKHFKAFYRDFSAVDDQLVTDE